MIISTIAFVALAAFVNGQVVSSATAAVGSAVSSATAAVVSAASSIAVSDLPLPSGFPTSLANYTDILSGTLNFPNASTIESDLNLNDTEVAQLPLSALVIPGYANFTNGSWNLRVQGLAYKLPALNDSQLDDAANTYLPGVGNLTLNSTEQILLRNRTHDLMAIPQSNENLTFLVSASNSSTSGANITLTEPTDTSGEFDEFVMLPSTLGLSNSSTTQHITLYGQNLSGPANGSAILVPTSGYSIVSDIDDVLRITKVYQPLTGLRNSFAEEYVNLPGMPELFEHWESTLPGVAFHYDTTTPAQLTRTYVEYLFGNYPIGSLDMRPINLTEPSAIFNARQTSLVRLFETFPDRKFVLIGDTSSSTLLSAYPSIAQQFPDQIGCIFIRNTSATDGADELPFDTSGFANLSNSTYFFYTVPEDLYNLNISGGQCRNDSIPQNLTFGEMGGPFTNGSTNPLSSSSSDSTSGARVVGVGLGAVVVGLIVAVVGGVGV
ncbi:hypothetical protein YB2330_003037 [Saitoella coloradoensis]